MSTSSQYAIALYELLEDKSDEGETEIIERFVVYLVRSKDLKMAPEIISAFEDLSLEREGKKRVFVESAREISGALKNEIKKIGPTTYKENPSLIGGIRIQIGDMLVDGTIKKYISQLKGK